MTRVSSETVPDAVNKVQVELLHNSSNFGLGPSGLDNSCRSFSCRRELLVPQLDTKFMGPVVISLVRFLAPTGAQGVKMSCVRVSVCAAHYSKKSS